MYYRGDQMSHAQSMLAKTRAAANVHTPIGEKVVWNTQHSRIPIDPAIVAQLDIVL